MSQDSTKINFSSAFPVDKILYEDTISINIGAGSSATPSSAVGTKVNTTLKKCFITYSFSVDGTNFYTGDSAYSSNGNLLGVDAAVDGSLVYFYITSTIGSAFTVLIHFALDNIL